MRSAVVGAGLAEECRVERKMRFDGGGEDWRGQEGRVSFRHSRGRRWAGVDKVKYRGWGWSYLGRGLVRGDVVRRQAGGTTVVGRQGGRGDKVVVMVDLVDHRGQSLDSLGSWGGVVVRGVVRRLVRQGWQGGTNHWTCWRYEVSRVEYPGRFWLQAWQDTNTHRLQRGHVLRSLWGLRSDTVGHVKWTDISWGDWSVVT